MSDASGPQKIEVLESNVEETIVKLSHTRLQIEQMMGTMQQLLQAKPADGGQPKEKPGGTGWGDANDDSDGTGRTLREEGAAGARVGATTATAAGERVSNHSSRASDGSRPTDDTSRRPEVPAGVSPMINMQRGETRDSFLADIAAHGDVGVLSSDSQRQPRVGPPVLKGKKGGLQKFKHEFLVKANILDISGHYVRGHEWYQSEIRSNRRQCCYGRVFEVRKSEGRIKRGTL